MISARATKEIMTKMWSPELKDDPAKWVLYAFPWGQKGTPLEKFSGPRKWQMEEFENMRDHIAENKRRVERGEMPEVYKFAMSSGRGPGKSAFVAMVSLWFMSCILGGTEILSANSEDQLVGKTFGEIGKWKTLCLSGYWFDATQTKLTPHAWFTKQLETHLSLDCKYYYASGVLWDEARPDAFAGAHNYNGMLLIFDEASGIPEVVWNVSAGFFTEPTIYRFWFAFSNPRRNTGAFYECFHKDKKFWRTRKLDSRSVEGMDHGPLNEIIAKNGEHSDEARIEVYGDFPSHGDKQFISRGIVMDAVSRKYDTGYETGRDLSAPLVIGCDPARYGGDATVIRFRQGRDARSIPPIELRGVDNMQVANTLAQWIDKLDPDGVFIDAGSGAGIIDRLREMGYKVYEVWFGSASNAPEWADHRTELWANMREWLSGGMIDEDRKLLEDLCAPEFEFTGNSDKVKLESKEKMRRRGVKSTDHADALAVTFHLKIARRDIRMRRNSGAGSSRRSNLARNDYNPFD